jgi:aldose 1-epimerase
MEWTVRHAEHAAIIEERGGGLRSYTVDGASVVDDYPMGERPPGGAGQILAPWPNRIRDGRYTFDGRTHELALTEPEHANAIHGLVRRLPWVLVDKHENQITAECSISDEPGYPFRLRLTTTWSVSDDGLRAEHAAENVGFEPAPFGLGVHPYLCVRGVDRAALTVPADDVLLADTRGLPGREVPVADADVDFRTTAVIGTRQLDHAFRATGPVVRLDDVELWRGEAFPWVQVFTGDTLDEPRRRRSVAIEPMTCPADAFNSGVDLIRLEPGETWRGQWGIRRFRNGAIHNEDGLT